MDDMILACLSDQHMRKVKDALSQRFDIKDLGRLHHFLGVIFELDEDIGCAWIGQRTYTSNLLEKYGMNIANVLLHQLMWAPSLLKL